jgi:hypothetical protein
MKHLLRIALATLFAAALLPAAHAYDPADHEIDDLMPAFGWEDVEWLDDSVDNLMPAF